MTKTRQVLTAAALGAVSAFTLLQISSAGAQEATTDSTEVPAVEAPAADTDDSTADVPEKDCPEDGRGGGGGGSSSSDSSTSAVDGSQV